jgi:hypothetical protein
MYDIEQMNRHLQSWMGNGATARAIPLELKCSFGGRAPKSRPLGRSMCDSSEGGAKPFASSSSAAVHWSTHARRQVARAGGGAGRRPLVEWRWPNSKPRRLDGPVGGAARISLQGAPARRGYARRPLASPLLGLSPGLRPQLQGVFVQGPRVAGKFLVGLVREHRGWRAEHGVCSGG